MDTKVDQYINALESWRDELDYLRIILQDCGLKEEFKWRAPCYTLNGKNVVIIGGLKDSFVLSFLKGVLMKDQWNLLKKPGENSQSARFMQFSKMEQIRKNLQVIRAYILEAIEIEKAGLKVDLKAKEHLKYPEELLLKFKEDPDYRKAFESLTPGRKRGYNMHFLSAKQSSTRESRIKKSKRRVVLGKGLNDCICGMSKRYPNCDGSHNKLNK